MDVDQRNEKIIAPHKKEILKWCKHTQDDCDKLKRETNPEKAAKLQKKIQKDKQTLSGSIADLKEAYDDELLKRFTVDSLMKNFEEEDEEVKKLILENMPPEEKDEFFIIYPKTVLVGSELYKFVKDKKSTIHTCMDSMMKYDIWKAEHPEGSAIKDWFAEGSPEFIHKEMNKLKQAGIDTELELADMTPMAKGFLERGMQTKLHTPRGYRIDRIIKRYNACKEAQRRVDENTDKNVELYLQYVLEKKICSLGLLLERKDEVLNFEEEKGKWKEFTPEDDEYFEKCIKTYHKKNREQAETFSKIVLAPLYLTKEIITFTLDSIVDVGENMQADYISETYEKFIKKHYPRASHSERKNMVDKYMRDLIVTMRLKYPAIQLEKKRLQNEQLAKTGEIDPALIMQQLMAKFPNYDDVMAVNRHIHNASFYKRPELIKKWYNVESEEGLIEEDIEAEMELEDEKSEDDYINEIRKLAQLMEDKMITQEEYEQKKKILLGL